MPTPCIYVRNSVIARREESYWPSLLAPNIESHSSIKIIDGFYSLARLNNALIIFSVSPTYLLTKVAAEISKKVASASVAHALARNVFPVPGGPYKRIPFQGFLTPSKIYGNFIGIITASFNDDFAFVLRHNIHNLEDF